MRFLLWFVLFVVGIGLLLQTGTQIPYLQWVGHLPGDLVVHKNGAIIYFPLTTSLIISLILTLLFGNWRRKN